MNIYSRYETGIIIMCFYCKIADTAQILLKWFLLQSTSTFTRMNRNSGPQNLVVWNLNFKVVFKKRAKGSSMKVAFSKWLQKKLDKFQT